MRWDRTEKERLRDSQIEGFRYNNEGSPRTGDLPNPEEQIKLHERIFVSLVKRLKFLKKASNNLVVLEMANVPYVLAVCGSFRKAKKNLPVAGGGGGRLLIIVLLWVLDFEFLKRSQMLQIFIYPRVSK